MTALVGKWSHSYRSATRHFWVPDVKNMIEEVALMTRVVSKVDLESFKKQRKEHIETIHSVNFVLVDTINWLMTGSIFLQAATGHKDWMKKFALERQLDKVAL